MKRIAILCTAALASLALMVAIGSASASASTTVLCKSNVSICPKSEVLPSGSWISFAGGYFKLKNAYTFQCNGQIFGTQSMAESAEPLPAKSEGLIEYCGLHSQTATLSCTGTSYKKAASTIVGSYFGFGVIRVGSSQEPFGVSYECQGWGVGAFKCAFTATEAISFETHYSASEERYVVQPRFDNYVLKLTEGNGIYCGGSTAELADYGYLATGTYVSIF